MSDIKLSIKKASEEVGKYYSFNEKHDPDLPAQMWFQKAPEGLVLFVVFYTQACRYSKCLGCNLPSKCSLEHIGYRHLLKQIDNVFSDPKVLKKRKEFRKIIISNNGSVLDQKTFSSTALMHLMVQVNLNLPNLKIVSLETRPEYVEIEELEFLKRALEEEGERELELAVGFESFDCHVRNDVFFKGLELEKFEEFVNKVSPFEHKIKCYFMQKPIPKMSDEEGIEDIKNAIDYLSEVSEKYNVEINMHLNPTYVASGTKLESYFNRGEYTSPQLKDVIKSALHAKDKPISVFLGLYDEGLAVKGGSFIREGEEKVVEALEIFNRTQSFMHLQLILEEYY